MHKEWHEDDRFWTTFAPAMFTADRWASTPEEVTGVIRLAGVRKGARVLDMCCGPGRHSLELARRGYAVTGVDRTVAYLRRARAAAKRQRLAIDFERGDMRTYAAAAHFDLALSLYTSFSYFEDPTEDRRVIERFHANLAQGGTLVIEMMGKEVLARLFQARDWHQLEDDSFMLEERQVDRHWSFMKNRWVLVQGGKVHEHRFEHRLYSGAELEALLLDVGFVDVQILGGLDGSPYDRKAMRLVAVAKRPKAKRRA
ncbi:MAG: class I SAM-dependent methyltransferase [Deltaproteobacteria bacterium]|nr:class I SAM-dependent methyltransferase [Deltaproteobacteria bacterium]